MNVTRNRNILKFLEDHKRELDNLVSAGQTFNSNVVTTINLVFDAVEAGLFTDDDVPHAVYDAILDTFKGRNNKAPVQQEKKKPKKLNRVEIFEKFLVDHKEDFDTLITGQQESYNGKNPICAKLVKAAKALNIYSKTSTEYVIFGSLMNMNRKGVSPVIVNRMGKRTWSGVHHRPWEQQAPPVIPVQAPPVIQYTRPEATMNPVNLHSRDIRDLGLTPGAMKIVESMLQKSIETRDEWYEYVNNKESDAGISVISLSMACDDLMTDRYEGFRDYNLPLMSGVKLSDFQMVFDLAKHIDQYINRCADEMEMMNLWEDSGYIIPCPHPRPERHQSREIDGQYYILVYPEPVPQIGDLVMYRTTDQDVKVSEVLEIIREKYLYLRNDTFVPINQAYVAMHTTPPLPVKAYSEYTMTVKEAMMKLALMDPDAILMFQDEDNKERPPITVKMMYEELVPKEGHVMVDSEGAEESTPETETEEPKTKFILLRG